MTPGARGLIVDLLSAATGRPVPVNKLVQAGAAFDIRETSIRVAIVRLVAAGTIALAGRGAYQLGEKARGVAQEVEAWRTVEKRVRAWDGAYAVALGDHRQAFQLAGLRALDPGFWVRPDNLAGSIAGLRERLTALGTDGRVFRATDFEPRVEARIRGLWDTKALEYRKSRLRLEKWLQRVDRLSPDLAARESFLLGGDAIRQIVLDPLLPAGWVDVGERKAFFEAMREFDRVGRGLWLKFLGVR